MKRIAALCVTFAVLCMTSGLALLHCPFLVASDSSCCHRQVGHPKCPLSKSFDTCPYLALDAKVGTVDGKTIIAGALPLPVSVAHASVHDSTEVALVDWIAADVDLHLRNRVLLI